MGIHLGSSARPGVSADAPGRRMGRLLGVELHAAPGAAALFALMVAELGGHALPRLAPRLTTQTRWEIAVTVAALFFLCLLARLLVTARLARTLGVPVSRIVLSFSGGEVQRATSPPRPRAEVLPAVAAMTTNLALGVALLALGSPGTGAGAALLSALGGTYLAFAAFQLLPCRGLDGGQLLYGLLWAVRSERPTAQAWTCACGRILGWCLLPLAAWAVLDGGYALALWLLGCLWLLQRRAGREWDEGRWCGALDRLRVSEVMTGDEPEDGPSEESPPLPHDVSVRYALEELGRRGVSSLRVERQGRVVGWIGRRRIARWLLTHPPGGVRRGAGAP